MPYLTCGELGGDQGPAFEIFCICVCFMVFCNKADFDYTVKIK